jgi:hypothetical protein
MSALPKAVAQAAAVTAFARAWVVQAVVEQSLVTNELSSVVTVEAAGWWVSPEPNNRAAMALVTTLVLPGYVDALIVTPGNAFVR